MVDLVKVRKKAKEKQEDKKRKETAAEPQPTQQPSNRATVEAEANPSTRKPVNPSTRIAEFIESAGRRRDATKSEEAEKPEAQRELLVFNIAGEQYAIDIEHVVEIITPRPITRVPNADPSIVGILSLRGAIVTIIDVRARLRHPASNPTGEDVRIIVANDGSEDVGFVVDSVQRVVKVNDEAVEPAPVVHTSEHDDAVRGVFRHNDTLTILLDVQKVLGGINV